MYKEAIKGSYRSAVWVIQIPICELVIARGADGWGLEAARNASPHYTQHITEWLAHSQIRFARTRTRAELERVIWAGWERWLETLPAELRAQLQTERSSGFPFSR